MMWGYGWLFLVFVFFCFFLRGFSLYLCYVLCKRFSILGELFLFVISGEFDFNFYVIASGLEILTEILGDIRGGVF